jgi:hypothetical protein
MTFRRSITNFDAVVSDMRSERRPEPTVLRGPDGSWDKSGIMKRAHQLARRLGPTCRLSWKERLGISLRTAWQERRLAGRPASPSQVDRRWPMSRLLASARQEMRS